MEHTFQGSKESAFSTSAYDYALDDSLIAQSPAAKRQRSRLMTLNRSTGVTAARVFGDLPRLLRRGDLLILNNTRVIPAKFFCRRATGGEIEGLFLHEMQPGLWQVLLKGADRCRVGQRLHLERAEVQLELVENQRQGQWLLRVHPQLAAQEVLSRAGLTPLPPYIRRDGASADAADRDRYQTVYASRPGAVAAPTAGLHFTTELLAQLAAAGVRTAEVTLHVGMGTFLPVKTDDITLHRMHREWFELPARTARAVNAARREGRRIVAVGTTSVRVLESAAAARNLPPLLEKSGSLRETSGWTDIFIYPPYRFRAVSALITNFHLPRSTLLMLVSAFASPGETAGIDLVKSAYAAAQKERYRFFSYGDAMLIE